MFCFGEPRGGFPHHREQHGCCAYKELEQLRVLVKDRKIDEYGQRASEHAAELAATQLQLEKANIALRAAERNNAETIDDINGEALDTNDNGATRISL